MKNCRFWNVGRQDYRKSWSLQQELVEARKRDLVPDSLVQVEHSPVVTLGRFKGEQHLLLSREAFAEKGIELVPSDRGGDVTYHGPGQLVMYPVLGLDESERSVSDYLRRLEDVGIRTLAHFGLQGERVEGMTGVWVGGKKILAIGVRLSRWVTSHGLALNVCNDLEPFSYIVPCGLQGKEVTSLSRELGRDVSMDEAAQAARAAFEDVFERRLVASPGVAFDETEDEIRWRTERPHRLPPWLKMTLPYGTNHVSVDRAVHDRRLNTVCESARCPNLGECWSVHRTATFMILGNRCTRFCRFCSVPSGKPDAWETDEPERVADAAAELGLAYVVLTSVDRDDMPDLGAVAFARTIRALRDRIPGVRVEVLTPDFQGNAECVATVLDARPDIFAHNLETVPSLYRYVRPGSHYYWSLDVLREAARSGVTSVKTSLMLGLGESTDEILNVMADARDVGVDIVTLGQYLRPTPKHHEVKRFLPPSEFLALKQTGEGMGLAWVESGPLVRSSYHASDQATALSKGSATREAGGCSSATSGKGAATASSNSVPSSTAAGAASASAFDV